MYAQRVNSSGVVQWTSNGVVICNATGSQSALAITTSGISGAIISWKDQRSGTYEDIYAQKVSLTGAVAWTVNGVPIITGALSQKNVSIAGDGSGGVFIVWQDSTLAGWDIYSQRVDANGVKQWGANGVAIGTAANDQILPDNISDGRGGCIFAFQDKRNTLDFDIYAHHLYADGTTIDGIYEHVFLVESKCFPNPFSSSANIEITTPLFGKQSSMSLVLYDVFGKKVEAPFSLFENKMKISRGNLQNGIYFYEIMINNTEILKGKFVLAD